MLPKFVRVLIVLFVCYSSATASFGQKKSSFDYDKQWKIIDSILTVKNLPKTALLKVDALYAQAHQDKIVDQSVKSLLYKYQLEQQVSDRDAKTDMKIINDAANNPINNVEAASLWFLKAKIINIYYGKNGWKIANRKDAPLFKTDDLETWSQQDFERNIYAAYQTSLSYETELQNATLKQYDAIIAHGNADSLRPTLFDLIAQDAIQYYKGGRYYNALQPKNAFVFNQKEALSNASSFIQFNFVGQDTLSHPFCVLKLYQRILSFHQNDKDKNAFIDADNDRLEWVYSNIVLDQKIKDSLYLQALQYLLDKHPKEKESLQSAYLYAAYYDNLGSKYEPFTEDSIYRWEKLKAMNVIDKYWTTDTMECAGWAKLIHLKNIMEKKQLGVTKMESINIPDLPFLSYVKYRNMHQLFIKVVRLSLEQNIQDWQHVLDNKIIDSFSIHLPHQKDLQYHSSEVKLNALPVGRYGIFISGDSTMKDNISFTNITVSHIGIMQAGKDFYIVDRKTGHPLAYTKIIYQERQNNRKGALTTVGTDSTDRDGHFSLRKEWADCYDCNRIIVVTNEDTLIFHTRYYWTDNELAETVGSDEEYEEYNAHITFNLDRNVYRPGQTVYFKGIVTTEDQSKETTKLYHYPKPIIVYLRDPNNKLIDSISVNLNEFASFAGKFVLPIGRVTGQYHIDSDMNDGSKNFSVEEYKRPTFYIDFDTLKSSYQLNDLIMASGKAKTYSGSVIDKAKVKVHIERRARFPYTWMRRSLPSAGQVMLDTTVYTDTKGKFLTQFKAVPDLAIDSNSLPIFTYDIQISITDNNGETRSGSQDINIGYVPLVVRWNVEDGQELDSMNMLKVIVENNNHVPVSSQVEVSVSKLQSTQTSILNNKLWENVDVQLYDRATFKKIFPYWEYNGESDYHHWPIEKNISFPMANSDSINRSLSKQYRNIYAGWYKVEAIVKSANGKIIKDIKYVRLKNERNPLDAFPNPLYLDPVNSIEIGKNKRPNVMIGTSFDSLYILQLSDTSKEGNIYVQKNIWLLKNGIQTFKYLPFIPKETNRQYLFATFKNNRYYARDLQLSWEKEDNNIVIEYKTFRDKTEPGTKEKWIIQVKDKKGKKNNNAELLSSMYDASLDQILKGSWNTVYMNQPYYRSLGISVFFDTDMQYSSSIYNSESAAPMYFHHIYPYLSTKMDELKSIAIDKQYNLKNVTVQGFETARKTTVTSSVAAISSRDRKDVPVSNVTQLLQENVAGLNIQTDCCKELRDNISKGNAPPQLRTNFNETAFFLPQLHADKDGNYTIEFEMPDAVTQWKWRNLAYTKDLQMAYNDKLVSSQKTVMVQPNLPRFLRAGDSIVLSAKVSNLSTKDLKGKAYIQLLDGDSTVLDWLPSNYSSTFSVVAGQTGSVVFPVKVPGNYSGPLKIKIWVKAENYSDGELHEIPVLSRQISVTETLPFELRGDTTMHFTFDKLKNNHSTTLQNKSLTVEFSSNPVWYAVQALPYLMDYPYECSEQVFNKFYANSLANYTIIKYPKIKETFNLWLHDTSVLKSNLQKNQELKQVILEETPWLAAAESESVQKRNIAKYFIMDSIAAKLNSELEKLAKRQLPDGSFPWFDGMRGDRYITQYIVNGMGKLWHLDALSTPQQKQVLAITDKARNWLRDQMDLDYNNLLQTKNVDLAQNHASTAQVQYLFAESYFPKKATLTTAEKYYYNQCKKYWNSFSNVDKALVAAFLYRNSDKALAVNTILKSLIENAVESPIDGTYWKSNYNYFYGYQSNMEIHSQMMDIIHEIADSAKNIPLQNSVEEMQHYLIRNKQTNNWKTTKATADACYALLSVNKEWQTTDEKYSIRLGGTTLVPTATEAGTGYFKTVIPAEKIHDSLGDVTVALSSGKKQKHFSYGSIYWQYLEDMNKITTAVSPLSLQKNLFKEVGSDAGKQLVPIAANETLKIGDKIVVRLTLNSERDLEYVHLKDLRGAALEPENVLSGYKWQNGLGYYESTKDVSSNFFIGYLPKGIHVFEYALHVTHGGQLASGIANIECMYAPEFNSHSEGTILNVE